MSDFKREEREALAAPAVQGEPVAWMTHHDEPMFFATAREASAYCDHDENPIPLYAAPQPAEQQSSAGDSLTSVPDEVFAAEFAAWWDEHGQFCRAGGGTYEQTFAFEAWRHLYPQLMNLQMAAAEQHPAPDVSALVEALQTACEYLPIGSRALELASIALAAHRKQQEPSHDNQ